MSDHAALTDSAPCGLYLVLPDHWNDEAFFKVLREALMAINASSYAKNNHVIEFRQKGEINAIDQEKLKALIVFVRSRGINFIVYNDTALAKVVDADGVLLSGVDMVDTARGILGDQAIIGVRCGMSRDIAEQALQAGVDYVSFNDSAKGFVDPSMMTWWAEKTETPCLVEGNLSDQNCAFYVRGGAYFIDASDYVWRHEKGVMQGIVNMRHAIDVAAGKVTDKKDSLQ